MNVSKTIPGYKVHGSKEEEISTWRGGGGTLEAGKSFPLYFLPGCLTQRGE